MAEEIKKLANGLASLGRYEDSYIVHAADGETVIPSEVFDENPSLKEDLFKQMRAMGVEPERYIVGNELNSINPVTGQPEFFFKKIGKMLKKAAPIIGSVVGFAVGGPAGAAIGSGLGSLAGGKSAEEALLSAGLSYMGSSYLTPSMSSGLQSAGVTGTLGSAVGSSATGQIANQPLANILAAGGTALLTDQSLSALGDTAESGEASNMNDYMSVVDQYYADLAAGLNPELPPQLAKPPQDELIQPQTMADLQGMDFSSEVPSIYSNRGLAQYYPDAIKLSLGGRAMRPEGYFRGRGGPTDDLNHVLLSDTEYVMKSNAVKGADPTGQNNPDNGAKVMDGIMAMFDQQAKQNARYA
jgi:hypothetical protein